MRNKRALEYGGYSWTESCVSWCSIYDSEVAFFALFYKIKLRRPAVIKNIKKLMKACVFVYACSHGSCVHAMHDGDRYEWNNADTPLHQAARLGDVGVVKELLHAQAAIDVQGGRFDETPLHYAATGGHGDVIESLIAGKADVNASDELGLRALHKAVIQGHGVAVKQLLRSKAAVDAKAKSGNTPLHSAMIWGKEEVAGILIDHGASVEVDNNLGQTAGMIARQQRNQALIKMVPVFAKQAPLES